MAKLGIFTGTSANDTTGDTLAQGAVKINSNFSEIYTALGDGTNITNSLLSITVAGFSTFTSGPVLVGSGIQTGDSKLQVSGDTFITGSVGVGTTNPTSKLHIIGDGRFTGVVTALSFSGNSSSAGYAITAGIATYATNAGTSTSVIGGIGSITQLRVTGISTFTNGPVLIGGGTSTGTAGQVFQVSGISSGAYIGGSVGIGTTNPTESLHVVGNVKVTGTITGEVSSTVATARTSTSVIGGIASVTQLQVGPGITTVGFITATGAYIGVATVGFLTTTNIRVSGVATVGFLTATNAYVGVATVGFITATNAYVSGVSTFVGNSYFSNSIGIGITTPTSSLSVNGSTVIGTQILDMTGVSSTFTSNGTFTVPVDVTKISAVLIGGGGAGGGGGGTGGGQGGGGGGLRYINDFAVTAGQVFSVIVGTGGAGGSGNGGNGEDSQIVGIATAYGGRGGSTYSATVIGIGGTGTATTTTIGGGTGGAGGKPTLQQGAGGGGAAGYIGAGGTGGGDGAFDGASGSGGGAGGGSIGDNSSSGFGANGGGGIGVLGQGSSGASATNVGGNGGSGGSSGVTASTPNGAAGGLYGGGGGGGDGTTSGTNSGGNGAQGVVRIIWSPSSKFSRLFPTNQVGNNINQ